MIPRGKLSISFLQLFKAIGYCLWVKDTGLCIPNWEKYPNSLFCLSARTGLDLTFRSLNLPHGSEILVTNINIPDMFAILKAHQLVCIPLTVDKKTLSPDPGDVEAAISPLTKAILVTHLFGSIAAIDPIIGLAERHHLIVIEDCAQAFNFNYHGNPKSDVALFSFGLIKTNTCLTGAMISFYNEALFREVTLLNAQLPTQPTRKYFFKIIKAFIVKIITIRWCYTLLYRITQLFKKDFDAVLAGFTKGFPGSKVMEKISFRPCAANERLLFDRTSKTNLRFIEERKKTGMEMLARLAPEQKVGDANKNHSHWVLPIECEDPRTLISNLRGNGIDASAKASSLISIETPAQAVDQNALHLDNLVYLPIAKEVLRLLDEKGLHLIKPLP